MKANPERKPLAERLKAGLQEGIAYATGKIQLRTVHPPERPLEKNAGQVFNLSKDAGKKRKRK
jgi:hypothetical protein